MLLALQTLYNYPAEFSPPELPPSDTTTSAPAYEHSSRNTYGAVTALATTASDTIISYTTTRRFLLRGMMVSGSDLGKFDLKVAGSTKYSARVIAASPNYLLVLPEPTVIESDVLIEVVVTNNSGGNANFEGTLLGI